MRIFLAISWPEECRGRVREVVEKLKELRGVKTVEAENLHLTLKFLGEVPEEKIGEIGGALEEIKSRGSFPVKLKGVGVFPKADYIRVIWVGVEKGREEVEKLQKEVDNLLLPLNFKKDSRFHSHFTLARVKKVNPEEKEKLKKILEEYQAEEFGEFSVDSVKIMKSQLTPQGPIYSLVKEIKL